MTRAPGELLREVATALACFASTKHAQAHVQRNPAIKAEMLLEVDRIEALEREVRDAAQAQAEVGPEIAAFALDMQRELDANAHKGDSGSWRECSPEWLWNDTMYHAAKMIYAMKHGEPDRVREFAADVANMAMMTRDAYFAQAQAGAGSEGQGEGA